MAGFSKFALAAVSIHGGCGTNLRGIKSPRRQISPTPAVYRSSESSVSDGVRSSIGQTGHRGPQHGQDDSVLIGSPDQHSDADRMMSSRSAQSSHEAVPLASAEKQQRDFAVHSVATKGQNEVPFQQEETKMPPKVKNTAPRRTWDTVHRALDLSGSWKPVAENDGVEQFSVHKAGPQHNLKNSAHPASAREISSSKSKPATVKPRPDTLKVKGGLKQFLTAAGTARPRPSASKSRSRPSTSKSGIDSTNINGMLRNVLNFAGETGLQPQYSTVASGVQAPAIMAPGSNNHMHPGSQLPDFQGNVDIRLEKDLHNAEIYETLRAQLPFGHKSLHAQKHSKMVAHDTPRRKSQRQTQHQVGAGRPSRAKRTVDGTDSPDLLRALSSSAMRPGAISNEQLRIQNVMVFGNRQQQ